MFRAMRRNKQQLSKDECENILRRGSCGVLALLGDEDYPYAVPMSYVYHDGKLLFHGATAGHKVDAIRKCAKASFCVVDRDEVHPESYTTHYSSVIAFGKIRIIENEEEMRRTVEVLARKYAPEDSEENRNAAIDRDYHRLCMMELCVEHLSGKEARELSVQRGAKTSLV